MRNDIGPAARQPQRQHPIRRTDEHGQFLPERTNGFIGLQIRTGRRLLGWSRAATAERLGIDVEVFADYEHGGTELPAVTLARIAELMSKPIGWFSERPMPVAGRRRDLPASLASADTKLDERAPAAHPADDRPAVLLVDDALDVLVTLGAFLEGAGLRVIKARSGDDALRIVASDAALHAIVTDNAMPGLTGTELLLQSAQLRPSLPGLIVTGYADAGSLAELPSTVEVLCKPFRREDLVRRVLNMTAAVARQPAVADKPLA
jgi:CheY-like chemotaxis protein